MGIIANIIAGLLGSSVGQALFGTWGPTLAGMALVPSILGAVIVIAVVSFFFGKKNNLNKRSHDHVNRRKIDQAKGAAKEGVGKLTDDKNRKEGAAEKAAAKVKEVAEDVKDAIEGTIDGVKNIINKDKNNFAPFSAWMITNAFILSFPQSLCLLKASL